MMENESLIKFLVVFFCLVNAIYIGKRETYIEKNDYNLLIAAMFFTVIADFFLIMTSLYTAGLVCFCIVQFIHGLRLYGKEGIPGMPIRLALGGAGFAALFLLSGFNPLFAFGGLYSAWLVLNVIGAFKCYNRYPSPNNSIIVLGMALFLLCDICVMLYNVVPLNPDLRTMVYRMIWLFYLPSQALLSSSGRISIPEEEEKTGSSL